MVSIVFELDFFGPLCAISTGVEWPSLWGTMKVGDTSLNTIYCARNTGWGWKSSKLRAYFVPHSGLKKSDPKTNGAISTGIEWSSIWGTTVLPECQNAPTPSNWLHGGGLIFSDPGRRWPLKWPEFGRNPKKNYSHFFHLSGVLPVFTMWVYLLCSSQDKPKNERH